MDLYIDGIKRFSGEVTPGPFELAAGPARISGAGDARVVITDALGQVATIEAPIYQSPDLLRGGLSDWSVGLGTVRRDYGIASLRYSRALAASCTVRHGLTDGLTVEAHGEGGGGLVNLGLGGSVLLPFGGVANAAIVASRSGRASGVLHEAGISWASRRFSLSAAFHRASRGYADTASLHAAPIAQERDLAAVGFSAGVLGSVSASVVRQRFAGGRADGFVGMNWNRAVGPRLSLALSANRGFSGTRATSAFLSLTVQAAPRESLTATSFVTGDTLGAGLAYRRSLSQDDGWGWAADGSFASAGVQAAVQVDRLGPAGQATAGLRSRDGRVAGYAGYAGSIVLIDGALRLARKIDDGFALVSTGETADVPVRVHHQPVGRTGRDGRLLVTGLNAYQRNPVSIDPDGLPALVEVPVTEQGVVPAAGAGVIVRFPVAASSAMLITLVDETGQPLPVGAAARWRSAPGPAIEVGFDGQIYLTIAPDDRTLVVEYGDTRCSAQVPSPTLAAAARSRPVVCTTVSE